MSETATAGEAQTCFVIGPIGDRLAPVGTDARRRYEDAGELWEYVIEPACAAHNLTPLRADQIAHPGEITEQIFTLLRDADIVIADLTGGNPNVMYELGLRHTRDKITVQLGENERLPFDINTIRTIRFRRSERGLVEARDMLIEALGAAIAGQWSPVTSTRVWQDAPPAEGAAVLAQALLDAEQESDRATQAPDDDDAPGIIDTLAEGEAALVAIGSTMNGASQFVAELGDLARVATEQITEADQRGGGFAGRLIVAKRFAEELAAPVAQLEEFAATYDELLAQVDPMMDYLIGQAEANPAELDEVREFLVSTVWLSRTAAESMLSTASLADVYRASSNMSRDLRPMTKRAQRALMRFVDATGRMEQWAQRIEALPDWRPEEVDLFAERIESEESPTQEPN